MQEWSRSEVEAAWSGPVLVQEDMYNRHETDKVLQEWNAAQR